LVLCAAAFAQDSGRDTGEGRSIHFVRWERSAETAAVYDAAWRALEPHLVGEVGRRRLVTFDGDADRAREYFAGARDAAFIVAFGPQAASAAREALPRIPVIEVSQSTEADVILRADRERLADLMRLFMPDARKVAVFGAADEALKGFETVACRTAADAAGCDLGWVTEGASVPEGLAIPVVSTAADAPGALTVRPDPAGAGLKVAALVVGKLRDGREPTPQYVSRQWVGVDLGAARAVDYEVPLRALAWADYVRRAP